jgi:HK97 family phage major capsid protein
MDEFLAFLKENGYEGDGSLESIRAFIAESGITVAGDWESLFKAADPAPTKSFDASSLVIKQLKAENETLRRKAVTAGSGARVLSETAGDMKHKMLRNAYNNRVKAGRAKFGDAETAEMVGAQLRLHLSTSKGVAREYAQKANDLAIVGKTYSTQVNENGGYLITPEVSQNILYLTEASGLARRIATEQAMANDSWSGPRKTGIGAMTAMSEGATFTAVQPAFDRVNLLAKKAGAKFSWTREFWNDAAVNVADDIASSAAEAFALRVDGDYFLGDGTPTYNGHIGLANITTNTGRVTDVDGSGGWAALTYQNFLSVLGTPVNVSQGRLAWVASRQFFFSVMMRVALGQAKGSSNDMPIASLQPIGGSDAQCLGYPVYFEQNYLPQATANGQRAAYFGDFSGASMIGVVNELELFESEHTSAAQGLVDVFASARYAVNIHGHGRSNTSTGMIAALKTTA